MELEPTKADLEPFHSLVGVCGAERRARADQSEYQFPGTGSRGGGEPAAVSKSGRWITELHVRQFLVQFVPVNLSQSPFRRVGFAGRIRVRAQCRQFERELKRGGHPESGESA